MTQKYISLITWGNFQGTNSVFLKLVAKKWGQGNTCIYPAFPMPIRFQSNLIIDKYRLFFIEKFHSWQEQKEWRDIIILPSINIIINLDNNPWWLLKLVDERLMENLKMDKLNWQLLNLLININTIKERQQDNTWLLKQWSVGKYFWEKKSNMNLIRSLSRLSVYRG